MLQETTALIEKRNEITELLKTINLADKTKAAGGAMSIVEALVHTLVRKGGNTDSRLLALAKFAEDHNL